MKRTVLGMATLNMGQVFITVRGLAPLIMLIR